MADGFKVTVDFKGVEKLCTRLKKELATIKGVKAGYFEGDAYPPDRGGLELAKNALIQEYGATIHIPEQRRTIYRSYNEKSGEFNRKGRFVKKDKGNFAQDVVIPAHDVKIPPRPFMRNAIDKDEAKWARALQDGMEKELSLRQCMKNVGVEMQNSIADSIDEMQEPPNARSTIRHKKGSNNPLEDTGLLKNSVSYEVIKNDTH